MRFVLRFLFFFFNDTATTEIYTLSLHDALPIYPRGAAAARRAHRARGGAGAAYPPAPQARGGRGVLADPAPHLLPRTCRQRRRPLSSRFPLRARGEQPAEVVP